MKYSKFLRKDFLKIGERLASYFNGAINLLRKGFFVTVNEVLNMTKTFKIIF